MLEKLAGNTNGIGFSHRDIINICKAKLQRNRSDEHAAEALLKASRSLTDIEARIKLLKSAVDTLKLGFSGVDEEEYYLFEVDMVKELLVKELAQVIMEKGVGKYAVDFWKTSVQALGLYLKRYILLLWPTGMTRLRSSSGGE